MKTSKLRFAASLVLALAASACSTDRADSSIDLGSAAQAALAQAGNQFAAKRATCSNSRGGKCTVGRWRDGRAQLQTSGPAGTIRVVPPTSSGHKPFSLTFDGFSKDCSAEITCPNGKKVSCTATGTNTQCQSNATSVGCLTVNDNGEGTSGSSGSCGG